MRSRYQAASFQNEFTLYHIKPNIYIKRNKFVAHKQYLFSLLSSRNANKILTDQNILTGFLLCMRRNDTQTFKSNSCNKPFL